MSKKPPPHGFPLGNQDPSKRGLGRTQKQMRKGKGCGLFLLGAAFAIAGAAYAGAYYIWA